MRRRDWIVLYLLGLIPMTLAASLVSVPGYMDAEYYFTTAVELAEGRGFQEPYLWNYLDDPEGLPHPSHLYWMPLTSLIAALPMKLAGTGFRQAQLPFVLMAAGLPLLAGAWARRLGASRGQTLRAAFLATFPGFYLAFFLTTETFTPFAFLGSIALLLALRAQDAPTPSRLAAAGALVGLAHLTRADGILLLVPLLLVVAGVGRERILSSLGGLVLGYAAVMLPWAVRNLALTGAPLPTAGSRTLWLLAYDDLFTYPADRLSMGRWLAAGPQAWSRAWLMALRSNFSTLLAVNGLVFLAPLMAMAAWRRRSHHATRLTMLYLALLLIVMTMFFPYPGARGGFFHSGAALMPALWALAALGLDDAIHWAAKQRGWRLPQAARVLQAGALALTLILTVGLFWSKVVGHDGMRPAWTASFRTYREVGERLRALAPQVGIVAINNPPGFYAAASIGAVVIPQGGQEALHSVVQRYGVRWVVLERNHPQGLDGLYQDPQGTPWLTLVAQVEAADGAPIYLLRVTSEAGP